MNFNRVSDSRLLVEKQEERHDAHISPFNAAFVGMAANTNKQLFILKYVNKPKTIQLIEYTTCSFSKLSIQNVFLCTVHGFNFTFVL